MRKVFMLVFVLCAAFAKGQLYDAQWVFSAWNHTSAMVDFRNDTVVNYAVYPSNGYMTLTDANICDSAGNLLYYTNGTNIFGADGGIITNGDSLSPCPYTNQYYQSGLNIPQATLFIPCPGNQNQYYLFHESDDTLNSGRPGRLYYSLIDTSNNSIVIRKNVAFGTGIVYRDGGLTACKHANGRDYWLVAGMRSSNQFAKFLITPDTILGPYIQSIGATYVPPYDNMYSKFSQDGTKYVTGCFNGYVTVLDFDRCNGDFSNPVLIYNEESTDPVHNSITGSASVEFSPNGRFVYASNRINLNQYDLWAANVQDSVEVYKRDSTDYAEMNMLQIAPNGKLYASPWNGGYFFLHIINEPDKLGDSCNFVFAAYATLTANSQCLPNIINYKLGPLIGSACDTVYAHFPTNVNEKIENTLRIIPNPADKYAYVEVGTPADYEMQLLNENGQLLSTKQTRQVDIFDTEHLVAGVYFISVTNRQTQKQVTVKKLVVVH